MSTPGYVMYARTVQASVIKILMEALKDLLIDTTIKFDADGVRIVDLDNTHVVMIHLKLNASRFEEYSCLEPVSIGVNLANFHKLLKTVNGSDTLTLFLDETDRNRLGVRVENEEKRARTEYKLNLLDLDEERIRIPPVEVDTCVVRPSMDFQKVVRDMAGISERVEIKNLHRQLIMTCKGDFCMQETVLHDSQAEDEAEPEPLGPSAIVQGIFSLKYLVLFCKCSALCTTTELYLKNNYPLIVRYSVASLGELKLCLSPICEDI
jgi:proliferating cell nuclear antigen